MKTKISVCLLFVSVLILSSCDPKVIDPHLENEAKMKVKIINPKDSIKLGDSVLIMFEVPDSIILNGVSTFLSSKEICSVSCAYNLIDSVNEVGYISYPSSAITYTNPGNYNNYGSLTLAKVSNRLLSSFYVIPKSKGVYFLECRSAGSLDANNGMVQTKLVYDFEVSDKHLDLLRKAAGSKAAKLEPWIQNCENTGKGLYAFAVK